MSEVVKKLALCATVWCVLYAQGAQAEPVRRAEKSLPAAAQPGASAPAAGASAQPPLDPLIFLSNLVLLLTEADGSLKHEQVEKALGMTLKLDPTSNGRNYGASHLRPPGIEISLDERDSHADLNERIYFKYSLYMTRLEDSFGDWKKGQCLQERDVASMFSEAGWKVVRNLGSGERGKVDVISSGRKWITFNHLIYFNDARGRYYRGDELSCIRGIYMTEEP